MAEDLSKKRLGRGLAALIGEMDKPPAAEQPATQPSADSRVPIEFVSPNPRNPRRHFGEAELAELAHPFANMASSSQSWCVERPRRAATRSSPASAGGAPRSAAGLSEIPVLVRDVDDRTALELAIIENVQRADLNPVEEAQGYQQLIDDHNYSQADLGQVIGKSRSHVANTLRLLKLPNVIRDMLVDGALSAGHARTLVTAADPAALAKRIVDGGLVRAAG